MSVCLRPALVGMAAGVLAAVAVSPAHSSHLDYVIDDPSRNPDGVTLAGINSPWIIDGEPYSLCPDLSPMAGETLAASYWYAVYARAAGPVSREPGYGAAIFHHDCW